MFLTSHCPTPRKKIVAFKSQHFLSEQGQLGEANPLLPTVYVNAGVLLMVRLHQVKHRHLSSTTATAWHQVCLQKCGRLCTELRYLALLLARPLTPQSTAFGGFTKGLMFCVQFC